MGIGIVGEYVGRIFEQVKGRPLYIVATTIGAQCPPDSNLARATELNRQARELLAYAATMDSAPVEALPMPLHEEESRGE